MPRVGISITKSTSFRGGVQEFSNDYYYEVSALPDASQADTMIDNLVTLEKTFHASDTTFVRGRLWSQTGSAATSEMITQKNLTGVGARTPNTNMDKERAYLFRLRAGVDSRGNPVYLRKWYHCHGPFNTTVSVSASQLEQTGGFSTSDRASMVTSMQAIGDANGSALTPKLCAKGGRLPNVGASWSAHQYLEHHQFGDMWRAQ